MAEQTPPAPTPLLDLDTLAERPFVLIDQVKYELRTPEEVSVLEHRRLGKLGARLDAIEKTEDPSEEEEQEYEQLLKTLSGRVLLAPDEVKARLNSSQRVAVAVASQAHAPDMSIEALFKGSFTYLLTYLLIFLGKETSFS